MTADEAVAALNAIDAGDPEAALGRAVDILVAAASPSVQDAYDRCLGRTGPWWYA